MVHNFPFSFPIAFVFVFLKLLKLPWVSATYAIVVSHSHRDSPGID